MINSLEEKGQIAPVALMAFEHSLNFVFARDKDRVNVILYRYGEEPKPDIIEGGWL